MMNIFTGFLVLIAAISLIYYFINPENHNSWNGGNQQPFKPKSREGKLLHTTLQTVGLVLVWLIIIGVILAAIFGKN